MPNTTVTVMVGQTSYSVPWVNGMTAQQALETVYNQIQNAAQFSFAIQFFGTYQPPPSGPLGYLVIMLNGVYDLPNSHTYWAFLYNGQYAQHGIDYTSLNPGDTIQFVNEPYNDTTHQNTTVQSKRDYHRQIAEARGS